MRKRYVDVVTHIHGISTWAVVFFKLAATKCLCAAPICFGQTPRSGADSQYRFPMQPRLCNTSVLELRTTIQFVALRFMFAILARYVNGFPLLTMHCRWGARDDQPMHFT